MCSSIPTRRATYGLASGHTADPSPSESDETESYQQPSPRCSTSEQTQPFARDTTCNKKRRRCKGWRFGVGLNASLVAFVLTTNAILLIVATSKFKPIDGIGTLYAGDCDIVNRLNVGAHVFINAFSSVLLGASNYTMQCMMSPTRSECDAAHARGDWFDIGAPGIRNLRRISGQRRILWTLLLMTSIPIHLLYNSAVFKTLDTNEYRYVLIGDQFIDSQAVNVSQSTIANQAVESSRLQYHGEPNMYENLDIEACISAYGGTFVSGYSNVILITTNSTYDDMLREGNDKLWGVVKFFHDDGPPSGNELW